MRACLKRCSLTACSVIQARSRVSRTGTTALIMAAFAGCGLPGFANFVGEVTVLFGAWSVPALRLVTVLACWGALIIGAIYLLRAVRNILHADLSPRWANVVDAPHVWRKLPFAVLLASLIVFGCFPRLLTQKISPSAQLIVDMVSPNNGPAQTPQTAQASINDQSLLTSAPTK